MTQTAAPAIPPLPTPAELHAASTDESAFMAQVDRSLGLYFAARADVVAAELARRSREKVSRDTISPALTIAAVMARTGMSKQWLYKQARKGALPFARRIGRRLVFDAAGLDRWLSRRPR